jgi:hypothetical protein
MKRQIEIAEVSSYINEQREHCLLMGENLHPKNEKRNEVRAEILEGFLEVSVDNRATFCVFDEKLRLVTTTSGTKAEVGSDFLLAVFKDPGLNMYERIVGTSEEGLLVSFPEVR